MELSLSRIQIAVIYAVKGTPPPSIPASVRKVVTIEVDNSPGLTDEEIAFFEDLPIKEWERWIVKGATVGFTSKGEVRINCDRLGVITIWLKNTKKIYGIKDYGPIRGNYRLCHNCGKIAGQSNTGAHVAEEEYDRDKGTSILPFYCASCLYEWTIEKTNGRPRPLKQNGRNGNGHGQKPKCVKNQRIFPNWNRATT